MKNKKNCRQDMRSIKVNDKSRPRFRNYYQTVVGINLLKLKLFNTSIYTLLLKFEIKYFIQTNGKRRRLRFYFNNLSIEIPINSVFELLKRS